MAAFKLWRFVLFTGMVAVLLIPAIVLRLAVEPAHRAFSCADKELSYPYKADTIPYFALIGACVAVSAVILFATNYLRPSEPSGYRDVPPGDSRTSAHLWRRPRTLSPAAQWLEDIAPLFLSLAITDLLRSCFAFTLGFPRPHFLAVCKPKLEDKACASGLVRNHQCYPDSPSLLKEARLSFPAGQAAVTMACAVYIVRVLNARILYRPLFAFLSAVLMGLAIFFASLGTSQSYRHHLQDLIGGAFLGGFVSWLVTVYSHHTAFGEPKIDSPL